MPPRALSLAVTEVLAAQRARGQGRRLAVEARRRRDHAATSAPGLRSAARRAGRARPCRPPPPAPAARSRTSARYIEHGFDDAMERASGWYKRKVQVSLAVIAAVLTLGLNIDTAHVAGRLWTDGPLRSAVVARASDAGQPGDAASAVREVHDLGLPIGWDAGNRAGRPRRPAQGDPRLADHDRRAQPRRAVLVRPAQPHGPTARQRRGRAAAKHERQGRVEGRRAPLVRCAR